MLNIAIVTKPANASPKVLANCLHSFLTDQGCNATVFYQIGAFRRLLKYSSVKNRINLATWMAYKAFNYFKDQAFIKRLKEFDAVIMVETSPKCFLKDQYNLLRLKEKLGKIPLVFYEVYYLGNAPTILELIQKEGHYNGDIFDWHLAVSEVTEIRQKPSPPWSKIGLYLKSTGLKPLKKEGLYAVVDFERKGHEEVRKAQIEILEELDIPYLALSKRYTIEEIREIYKKATFYFIQFGESFGVPIAECLSTGAMVFTPDSGWAMAYRQDEHPEIHGPGTLAECFVVYEDNKDLKNKLIELQKTYDLEQTPKKIFEVFMKNYGEYYEGNQKEMNHFLNKLKNGEILAGKN